jgi:hypothetical protein
MALNAHATPFVPSTPSMDTIGFLVKTPFFQQRFERFVYTQLRLYNASVHDITQIVPISNQGFVSGEVKKQLIFIGTYKSVIFAYEADTVSSPRTGHFRLLATL